MHLIRLFKVRGHLGQQLIRADAHINRESQLRLHLVLQLGGHCNSVLPCAAQAHINEALINGELLQHRRAGLADGYEAFRALFVPLPVPSHDHKLRILTQCHRDRFRDTDSQFLCRNGCRRNDAPPVIGITRHNRRNKPDVRLALS